MLAQAKRNVVWEPIPDSSQEIALDTRCHQTLFHGARGPGKTDTQIMRFRRFVGMGYGMHWRGVIFDREYKNLDDLVSKTKRWFPQFGDGAQFKAAKSDYKWVWPTGEELLFRTIKTKDDYWDYHGQEFPFIGWNELCKWPTSELYDMLMSCNRSSFIPDTDTPTYFDDDGEEHYATPTGQPLPEIPLQVFATTNSYGPGHVWVKRRFIDGKRNGVPYITQTEVFNPRTQRDEVITKSQVAIFGSWRENIYLAPEYVVELNNITDDNMRKSWNEGSWDIASGGAFEGAWDRNVHVLPRFIPPRSWHLDRSFDWGSTHPFCVQWWAEANGEEATLPDGSTFCPPPGSLIQFFESYGTKEIGTNKGLRWTAAEIADEIIRIEKALMSSGWVLKQPSSGPADNQIRDVRESDVDTIETKFADKGILWEHSDKSPGSRKNGLQIARDMFTAAVKRLDDPHLYFMENCTASIQTIPVLPLDETKIDDVDTTAEDHPWDACRYRVLKGANRMAKVIKVDFSR